MLNFICAIPDSVGWAMVGFLMACDVFAFGFLAKTIINARKPVEEDED